MNATQSKQTQHTPVPWERNGNAIETVSSPARVVGWVNQQSVHIREAIANGEFIVRAVNAHDDLLAACRAIVEAIEHTPDEHRYYDVIDALRAAIAKATA